MLEKICIYIFLSSHQFVLCYGIGIKSSQTTLRGWLLVLFLTQRSVFQVFAAYDFTARGNHEVSVRTGEPVRVLEPHDKRGNPEWSLVEARGGQRGYVPSNYLAIMPVGTGPAGTQQAYWREWWNEGEKNSSFYSISMYSTKGVLGLQQYFCNGEAPSCSMYYKVKFFKT